MAPLVQIKRTATPNHPPAVLAEGELCVEMADPVKLWVGVPTSIKPEGKRLLTAPPLVVQADPPLAPEPNQLWWENDSGVLWLWYNDGNSSQWVQVSSSGGQITLPPTPAEDIEFTPGGSLSADDVQEALLELDNEKVAKLGDTMLGPLILPAANPTTTTQAAHKGYVDSQIAAVNAALATKIGEAPSDGNIYGRKNTAWVQVGSGGTVGTDAASVAFIPTGNIAANNVQTALAEVDNEKVAKAGDTMTGNLTVNKSSPAVVLKMTAPAGGAYIQAANGANSRWTMYLGDGTTEGGSNSGSSFRLRSYDDAGANLVDPLIFTRAGAATFSGVITAAAKGHQLGNVGGTVATGAVTPADANLKFYDFGSGNWMGMGVDGNGYWWLRVGGGGSPVPALYASTDQVLHFAAPPTGPTPTAGANNTQLATTSFVAGAISTAIAGLIPSGTYMVFCQPTAPTGWTIQTNALLDDAAMRLVTGVSGGGGGVGGSAAFSSVFSRTSTDNLTLADGHLPQTLLNVCDSVAWYPMFGHPMNGASAGYMGRPYISGPGGELPNANSTGNPAVAAHVAGGGVAHAHTIELRVKYVNFILAMRN